MKEPSFKDTEQLVVRNVVNSTPPRGLFPTGKAPVKGDLSDRAFNRVLVACEDAGLDPAAEIVRLLKSGTLSPKMECEIYLKFLEFIQPKLRSIEQDINLKDYSLVDLLVRTGAE